MKPTREQIEEQIRNEVVEARAAIARGEAVSAESLSERLDARLREYRLTHEGPQMNPFR